ncbi:MAG: hypothetical protein VYB65_14390 [Myxococcota bacterium]|nr:hypothetical protein [Myxococcota bacterium]
MIRQGVSDCILIAIPVLEGDGVPNFIACAADFIENPLMRGVGDAATVRLQPFNHDP